MVYSFLCSQEHLFCVLEELDEFELTILFHVYFRGRSRQDGPRAYTGLPKNTMVGISY